MLISKFNFAPLSSAKKQEGSALKNDNRADNNNEKPFEYFGVDLKQEEPKYFDIDLKRAKEEGYKNGFDDGAAQVQNQQKVSSETLEGQLVNLCNSIIQKVEVASKTLADDNKKFQQECILLASKIAKRIAGEALNNDPTENIAKLFESSIKEFYSEPEVNVKIHPKHIEGLNSRFSKIAIQKNFAGKINFIPDTKIAETDCILEWAHSGSSIKNDEVIQKIDAIIEEYCKSI